MADPKLALDLLLARDPIEASALAAELEEINRQRREIEAELTRDAMAKVEKTMTADARSLWAAKAGTRASRASWQAV